MEILIICLIVVGIIIALSVINTKKTPTEELSNVDTSEYSIEDEETGAVRKYKRTPQGYIIYADMVKYDAKIPFEDSRFVKFMEKEWKDDDGSPIVMETRLIDGMLQCYDSSLHKVYFNYTCPELKKKFLEGYLGVVRMSEVNILDNEFSAELWVQLIKEEPDNVDTIDSTQEDENTDESIRYKRTPQGYIILPDMEKYDAIISYEDNGFTDYIENEWMDEDETPHLMETALINGKLRCYHSSKNQVYFEYSCPALKEKFQKGYYGIVLLSDYKMEDNIKAEMWVHFEKLSTPIQGLKREKEYEDHLEIIYHDGKGMMQYKTIKNRNVTSFITGIRYRENFQELLEALEEGQEVQLIREPDNPYDPNAIAIYNGKDMLGYIPATDIPIVSLNMVGDNLTANIDRIDEDFVGITIPATFEKLERPDIEKEYGEFSYVRIEKAQYENGVYGEKSIPITKEEFIEAVKKQ